VDTAGQERMRSGGRSIRRDRGEATGVRYRADRNRLEEGNPTAPLASETRQLDGDAKGSGVIMATSHQSRPASPRARARRQ